MRVPGIVWTVALIALPLLAEYLTQYFSAAVWAVPVGALLLMIAKVIQEARAAQPPPGVAASAAPPTGRVRRMLVG